MNNININSSHERKKLKVLNKSDLSRDIINKNPLKYKISNKLSELRMNKNRNELKIKLQNNSGINSFRNHLYKKEIKSNSTNKNKNILTNTSKRKTSHKKILNNLFYNFDGEKQKIGKFYSKIDAGGIKRRLTEKKIRKEERGKKFMKNYELYKNRKLNLNINYINSSNNYNTKNTKGVKYLNSVGNNGVIDNNNNLNSIENKKPANRYNKIVNKKIKNKK
jgi:hypothetical protein